MLTTTLKTDASITLSAFGKVVTSDFLINDATPNDDGVLCVRVTTMKRHNGKWASSFTTGMFKDLGPFSSLTTSPFDGDVFKSVPHDFKRGTDRIIMEAHKTVIDTMLADFLVQVEKHPNAPKE